MAAAPHLTRAPELGGERLAACASTPPPCQRRPAARTLSLPLFQRAHLNLAASASACAMSQANAMPLRSGASRLKASTTSALRCSELTTCGPPTARAAWRRRQTASQGCVGVHTAESQNPTLADWHCLTAPSPGQKAPGECARRCDAPRPPQAPQTPRERDPLRTLLSSLATKSGVPSSSCALWCRVVRTLLMSVPVSTRRACTCEAPTRPHDATRAAFVPEQPPKRSAAADARQHATRLHLRGTNTSTRRHTRGLCP